MSQLSPYADPLGKMFTPEEKRILRDRDPGQRDAKMSLIMRLADAFTFRRAPRDWQPPYNCFRKACLVEEINRSRHCLPAMSREELTRADEVMKYTKRVIPQGKARITSLVAVDELRDVLRTAQTIWTKDGRDGLLDRIIDSIPNNARINKIVCIGLSEMAGRLSPKEKMRVNSLCLAQHLAVLSMTKYIRHMVGHTVELFAADWRYDAAHEAVLKTLGFTVLNPSHGKQEHFRKIDDQTMLICFSIADHESVLPIISEYARPVAMIYEAYSCVIEGRHNRPATSPVWSRVRCGPTWVTVPGPPLIETGGPARWLPFYTDSTGRMLDDYQVAMNLFDFDTTGLANKFELHPDTDYRLSTAPEAEQKRFAGKFSRLFVRKF
ncbi:hypothetical protein GGS20DRAFT_593039 [Poronia punctata]|nr:hypothetical protein GGS20DRAFT_593039 [Poronia punctata]